jgi:transposase
MRLSPGQQHDLTLAEELVGTHRPGAVIADKAYDADAFLAVLRSRRIQIVIPPLKQRRVQRRIDKIRYKQRNVIERFFNRLKHYRRVATRYDKTARNFFAFVNFAATLVVLGLNVNRT